MREFCYISPSHSIEGETQRMQYLFTPVIKEAVGDVPIEITIDEHDNNVYINGTPIGDYRKIYNINTDGNFVQFNYGSEKIYRLVRITDEFTSEFSKLPLGYIECVTEHSTGKVGTKMIVDNFSTVNKPNK